MSWPGEKLLIKLWDTLANRGIGGLLKPWQHKREARAQIESRRLEIVMLADAQREAEEIRAGRMELKDSRVLLDAAGKEFEDIPNPEPAQSTEQRSPREIAQTGALADAVRKEVNIAKSVASAEDTLKDDAEEPSGEPVNEDWLYRWREYAGAVSSEEMQTLWGRVLAGEVKAPGSYSLRVLDFLSNLSPSEAQDIQKVLCFAVEDFVFREEQELLGTQGVSFGLLLKMQELGVLSGVEAIGLTNTMTSVESDRFVLPLRYHGMLLLITHDDPEKNLEIEIYRVTEIGRQILRMGSFVPSEKYLEAWGERIKKEGFNVSVGRYEDVDEHKLKFYGMRNI